MAKIVYIADVCKEIFAGGDVPKSALSYEKTAEYNVPIFSNGEKNCGLYGYTNNARVKEPSITVSARGTIGYTAIRTEPFVPVVRLITLTPKSEVIDLDYLFYATQNYKFEGSGTSIPQLTVPILKKYKFPLPEMSHQKAIAVKFEKLDQLISLRKQQLAKLDELVKARFVEMFGDDIYPKVKVSRVCDFITKGTTPPSNLISEKYSSDKVPYLKVYNLSFTGKLLFDTAPQYVPENIHNGVLARSKVYPNDVLMNIVGPPLGKFALVTDEFSEWNINQAIAIFRAKEKVNPKYLLFALMQPEVLKPFLRQAVGIRQLNLSLAQCRDLEIPLPPLSLQSEFAAFVERVDQQKQTVQQSLEKLELMKKALMQEYFG